MKTEELINRAKLAIKVRDYDQAIKFLNKVQKNEPDISGINILLGIIHQKLKKYKEAIQYYDLALEKNSKDIDALNNLGIIYKELEKYDQSLEYLEAALNLQPKRSDILYNIGNVYKALGKNDEAVRFFQKALQINPNFRFAYNNLGTVYEEQGELDRAINIYQKGLKIDPNNPRLHYNLGIAYETRENLDGSLEEFRTALKINPNLIEAHNNLGVIYEKINRLEDAVKSYNNALEINPDYTRALNNLALVYEKLGDMQGAVKNYKKALSVDPKYNIARINLGRAYLNGDEAKKAKKTFEDIIRENPDNLDAYNDLARAEIRLKNYNKALEVYKYILEKHEDINVRNDLKDLYLELNMTAEAREELKKIVRMSGDNIEKTIRAARSYLKAKDFRESMKIVDEILKKHPDNTDALFLLSDILIANADYEKALKVLNKLEKLGINNSMLSHNYALCYQGTGKISKALTLMERLINKPAGQKDEEGKSEDFVLLNDLMAGYEAEMLKLEKEGDAERRKIREKLHDMDFKAILEGAKASVDSIEKMGALSIDEDLKGLREDDVPILNIGDTEPEYRIEEEEEDIDLDRLEEEKGREDEESGEEKIIEPVTNSLINLLNDEDTYSDRLYDGTSRNIDMSKRVYQSLANNFSTAPMHDQGGEQKGQVNESQAVNGQNPQALPRQNAPLMPQQNLVVPSFNMVNPPQPADNTGIMNQLSEKFGEIDEKLENFNKQVVERKLDDKLREIDEKLEIFKENFKKEFEGDEKYINIEESGGENPFNAPEEFEYDIDVENTGEDTETPGSAVFDDSVTVEEEDENLYEEPEQTSENEITIDEEDEDFMTEKLNTEDTGDTGFHEAEKGPYEKLRNLGHQNTDDDTLYRENEDNEITEPEDDSFGLVPIEEAAGGEIDIRGEVEDLTDDGSVINGVKTSEEPELFGMVDPSDYSQILDYFPPVDPDNIKDFESRASALEKAASAKSGAMSVNAAVADQVTANKDSFMISTRKIRGVDVDIFY